MTYDGLGRVAQTTVKAGNYTTNTNYTYTAGATLSDASGKTSTSGLVASLTLAGGSWSYPYTYTYDDNGNITKVVQSGVTTSYTYDALGQLTRVDDGMEGATWFYTYDQGGNILTKKKYVNGVESESKTFTYGNSSWKDQLTAVNGVAITYDAIGNPLNDGTWTYSWSNGRQLTRMTSVDKDVRFVYNENGLRVQKRVDGVATNYYLHGKNVVHMTRGSDELHFFYDAQNKPAVVVYNGTAYAYLKNLQGDIVAILNGSGTAVVSYVYDAWGRPVSKTGSMADTLGTLNPFRYRSYVYDEETGLYYLRSRYYNAIHCRFCICDAIISTNAQVCNHNLWTYCSNNPIGFSDASGYGKELSITAIEPFRANDWGTNTTKMPASLMIGFMIELAENYKCNYGDGLFIKERKDGSYNVEIDCIGVFNMPAKFWMTRETFRTTYNIGTGTNSALRNLEGTAANRLHRLDLNNLSVLNIGSVIYSEDKSHVYMYIGYYVSPTETVIEHAVLQAAVGKVFLHDTLQIQSIDSVLSPYWYGNYEYIEYDITYEDTVNYYNPPLPVGRMGLFRMLVK